MLQRITNVSDDHNPLNVAPGHRIDFTMASDYGRLENVTEEKVDVILAVVKTILLDEIERANDQYAPPYTGSNIYQDGRRVNYTAKDSYSDYDEFGALVTKHFLEFEDVRDAYTFNVVLNGLLMLGLTKFKYDGESFVHHWGRINSADADTHVMQKIEFPGPVVNAEYDWFGKAA